MHTDNGQHLLEAIGKRVTFVRNTVLPSDSVYYLLKGHCVLSTMTPHGKEYGILHFKPGMLLNFYHATFDPTTYHPFTRQKSMITSAIVMTKTECTFVAVPQQAFQNALENDTGVHNLFVHALYENYVNLLAHTISVHSLPAEARICQLLLDYYGWEQQCALPRYLTYAEIANFLSLHEITVAKIFRILRQQGVLSKEKSRHVILDTCRLAQIAHREISLDY